MRPRVAVVAACFARRPRTRFAHHPTTSPHPTPKDVTGSDGWCSVAHMREARAQPACCAAYDTPSAADSVIGAQVYAFGGSDERGVVLSTVEKYDPPSDDWYYW